MLAYLAMKSVMDKLCMIFVSPSRHFSLWIAKNS